jgi:4,5-DOPA dioxygenase extradiol
MKRESFIKSIALLPFIAQKSRLDRLIKLLPDIKNEDAWMPAFFIGHGNPNNAFKDNPFTRQLHGLQKTLPFKPAAILVISAHYLSLDQPLLKVRPRFENEYYPVDGAINFTDTITPLVENLGIDQVTDLDHGSWPILRHMFPEKDIPLMELSIAMEQPLNYHWKLAQKLKVLRDKGVLIVGSGNVVHNLELTALKLFSLTEKPFSWAIEMDEWIKSNIDNRNYTNLFNYRSKGRLATLAINTADHYIPMLYTLSLADSKEDIVYTYEEVFGAVSMRCFKVG